MNLKSFLLVFLIPLLMGCRGLGTIGYTAYAPDQTSQLLASSRTVVDVVCTNIMVQADYNLWENLSMLAPMPKREKIDVTVQVKHVIKGKYDEPTLQFHWLRGPTTEQIKTWGFSTPAPDKSTNSTDLIWPAFPDCPLDNGMTLRLGYDNHRGRYFQHLKILVPDLKSSNEMKDP